MVSAKVKIGCGLVNHVINALLIELFIPGYQFCGRSTHLLKPLVRGDRVINPLHAACRDHDIAYSLSNNLDERHAADKILANKAKERVVSGNSTLDERAAAVVVWAAMRSKTKLGMGLKKLVKKAQKKSGLKKKRILSIAKRGGILPIIPILGALGSLIGGAAGVAKAVNDKKAAQRQLEEIHRHNRSMEGRGLYLTPYKRGKGVIKKKKKFRR